MAIEKHLPDLIASILKFIKSIPEEKTSESLSAFRYLYILTKIRGAKRTLKYLPHQVDDLYWALKELKISKSQGNAAWEKTYCLLLCLSVTSLIPFNMKRFDTNPAENRLFLVEELIENGKFYLFQRSDTTQDAAGIMLGRLFARNDVQLLYLKEFIQDSLQQIENFLQNSRDLNTIRKTIGILRVLCNLIKQSKREEILPMINQLKPMNMIETLGKIIIENPDSYKIEIGIRLLATKLAQRIALLFLPQRQISWRYNRGSRTLDDLKPEKDRGDSPKVNQTFEVNLEVPEIIEDIIDIQLKCLTDKDTIVRWSAAKGIGRISARLPSDFVEDVLEAVLEESVLAEQSINTASAYHGVCLCLAELSRRGLITQQELAIVVPFITDKALQYDEKKSSTHSVGSNVRDAACYVCWAFARAYQPEVMKPHVNSIAGKLLAIATMDREVNCRRAASAAFQENVGRQGNFPSGISIVTKVDYVSVALRSKSILNLAPWVCSTDSVYQTTFLQHIIDYKLSHWDNDMRQLSAEAFSVIYASENDPNSKLIDDIVGKAVNFDNRVDVSSQHGCILALGQLAKAKKLRHSAEVLEIPQKISQTGRWKGVVGELMRPAVFTLIGYFNKYADEERKQKYADIAFETILSLRLFQEKSFQNLTDASVRCITSLGDEFVDLEKIFENWDFQDEKTRYGLAVLLGQKINFEDNEIVKAKEYLERRVGSKTVQDLEWTMSRSAAITALCEISSDGDLEELTKSIVIACNDFTISKQKGDIGCHCYRSSKLEK